ncbi:MAG: Tyrosine recombinase XerD [Anaerolineae bacterium]|nr:Tyrosine recombinase XerD [Anaerolineae bacterium]
MAHHQILTNGKIDIHSFADRMKTYEERLRHHSAITETNKKLIFDFLRDCELGKTVLHSQKKQIGIARLLKYIQTLTQLAGWIQTDFDKITQAEMETLVLAIEKDRHTRKDGKPFTPSVKRDFKVVLRKFYKWLLGDNQIYPPIVRWIDTRDVIPEIPCLRREQVEQLSELATNPRDRAIIWTLFDSGARAEEFLNIRFRHLEKVQGEGKEEIYRIRIEYSKTKPRSILLPISSSYINLHLRHSKDSAPDQQVFPVTYGNLAKILRELGKKVLKRRVNPHLFRHSSATYYATRLSRASFCNRFGWSYRSNMADRYIDREALTDQESVRAVREDSMETLKRENHALKEDLAQVRNQLDHIHQMMNTLTADPKVTQALTEQIRKTGQGQRLKELHANMS